MNSSFLNGELLYTLKVSNKAKRLRLAVYCDGRVVVVCPKRLNKSIADEFVLSKSNWIIDKLNNFSKRGITFSNTDTLEEYNKYKDEALELVKDKLERFNKFYNLKYNKINIRNQKTRWGSCSKKGNLNFNYKIIKLPERLCDYIIVHELCHLKEFNHSSNFWNLLEKTIPDYLYLRRELKVL